MQTDAVIKPVDCGGPLVDVDGRAIGMTVCRAGRTESWVLPTESVKSLTAMMLTERPGLTPKQRVDEAKAALKAAEDGKECADVIAEAKRYLVAATAEVEWWRDRKFEKGPAPQEIDVTRGPKPRTVVK
jgi:serine protease Do